MSEPWASEAVDVRRWVSVNMTETTKTLAKPTLNRKQALFCLLYSNIGTATFGNGTQSALAAGYKEASAYMQASRLLTHDKIKTAIQEAYAKRLEHNGITINKVLADLEHARLLALEKGDISAAIRASEGHGRYLAMFTDKVALDVDEIRSFSLREEKAMDRITRAVLKMGIEPPRLLTVDAAEGCEEEGVTPQGGGVGNIIE